VVVEEEDISLGLCRDVLIELHIRRFEKGSVLFTSCNENRIFKEAVRRTEYQENDDSLAARKLEEVCIIIIIFHISQLFPRISPGPLHELQSRTINLLEPALFD
jgi:hypothetical protein